MAGKDAEISVGADASAAERAAAVVKSAWTQAGHSITSAFGEAARSVISDLSNVALAQGKVSFSAQHQSIRDFEASSARLAVSMGRDLESVRGSLERTGVAIGKKPGEVAAWASEVGRLTYSFHGAAQAVEGIAALAAETGQSVDDYRGLAVTLGTVGKVSGDTSHAVGVLRAQADSLGTVGGVAAFADQIEGLRDTISHFAVKSEADFLRVTATAGALTKGLSDQAARRVQQTAFGAIASDPMRWSRYLGRDVTDEHGQVKDPTAVLREIVAKTERKFGGSARRVLMQNFGAETGATLHHAFKTGGFDEAARAAGLAPSATPRQKLEEFASTDAGKRATAEAELAVSSRKLMGSSTALGSAADALQQWAARNPITSTLVATALGSGMSTFMSGFGNRLSTMVGGKGQGGAVGGMIDLASKGTGWKKALGWAGGLGSAALTGAALGIAFDEMTGASDFLSGTGRHSKIRSNEAALDAGRDAALAGRVEDIRAQNERNKALRDQASALGLGLGGFTRSEGKGFTIDYDKLAAAIAAAQSKTPPSPITVNVLNASDTPVAAAANTAQGASAGALGG